ncbi:MAG: endonuclease/exonuclease/phosphatase family protein [Crocinitomicaceae bacterium]|nr:endonuclease/exonuclease/phosphatase family protein [Crocinitomicaceae bacterium]MDC0099517.1 endonuclease/exonuclease/phosphatase family protein [Crocinitomicaceae bacterium]MDC1384867.1 endonuclease/exonuclease/phosphatase family protein [Crocinitomicaceae bacterium]|tara:strand:+ start:520 stop:1635 length:1116 start_codon:yes stop_codon:yes gene_type:complete
MKRLKKIFTLKNILKGITIIISLSLLLSYLSPFVRPDSWEIIPLFGLAYPVIIVCHLIITIAWIFINNKWALGLGILILMGGNLHFRTFTIGGGDDSNGATEVKIMSYNVHLFDLYNSEPGQAHRNKDKIIQYVANENPDIVCFQEFFYQDRPSDFVTKDTLIQLLETKDYHERYTQYKKGRRNFGISIFSKYEIIEKGDIVFPDNQPTFNYCIYADIVTPEDTVRVYNIHLQSIRLQKMDYAVFDDKTKKKSSSGFFLVLGKVKKAFPVRANQTDKLVEHINNSPHPVVVCGDFNDTPMSYTYNQFNSVLTDAFRNSSFGIGKTYAGKIPAGRIDYIFHSDQIGSNNFVIQDENLSDHYAISCSIFKKTE